MDDPAYEAAKRHAAELAAVFAGHQAVTEAELAARSIPGKLPLPFCQRCLGTHAALRSLYESGPDLDQPVTVTITVVPGRRSQPQAPPGGGR